MIRVDPATGDRSVISGWSAVDANNRSIGEVIGNGPLFNFPIDVVREAQGTFAVLDINLNAIVRVDPQTGDRSLVPIHGPDVFWPGAITIEHDGNFIVRNGEGIERIHPGTGRRSLVSGCPGIHFGVDCSQRGEGPRIEGGGDVAIEAAGTIVATNAGAVIRVDPNSGNRAIVSERVGVGRGPRFYGLRDITVESSGAFVVAGMGMVGRIDPMSGDRVPISCVEGFGTACDARGIGPLFEPRGIAIEANGDFVVVSGYSDTIMRINSRTGDRENISGCFIENMMEDCEGSGLDFHEPEGIAIEPSGDIVVTEPFTSGVIRISPATGNRTLLSGCAANDENGRCLSEERGNGPRLNLLEGIAVEADGRLVVANSRAVIRIDAVIHYRTDLSL